MSERIFIATVFFEALCREQQNGAGENCRRQQERRHETVARIRGVGMLRLVGIDGRVNGVNGIDGRVNVLLLQFGGEHGKRVQRIVDALRRQPRRDR